MFEPTELPQVRIGDCGCILLADALPVGYRFKLTTLGDVRTPVYACELHDCSKPLQVGTKGARTARRKA
jgi:hypothetical protein